MRASAAVAARGGVGVLAGLGGAAGGKEGSERTGRAAAGVRDAAGARGTRQERPAAAPGRPQLSAGTAAREAPAGGTRCSVSLAARPPRPGKEFEAFALFKLPVGSPGD